MFWETGWHAGTLIQVSLNPLVCSMHTQTLLFILHQPQQNPVADIFRQVITGPTPLPPFLLLFYYYFNPTIISNCKKCFSNTITNSKVKLYPHVLPKMQPCTHKNKQWPSLSSVAKAILSRQPGLIFNLVDFLWADPPPFLFLCLWAPQPRDFEAAQITGNKDWLTSHLTPNTHYAFKGEEKSEWEMEGKKRQ